VLTFDRRLAAESAPDFVARVLAGELHAWEIVVGADFRFGRDRIGDVALLSAEGQRYGFGVYEAPTFGEPRWSSSAVRAALEEGDVASANETLGRPFVLRGRVEHGDARGGELGYATANLATEEFQVVPLEGIYAGAARTPIARGARRRSLLARAPSSTRTALSSSRSTCRASRAISTTPRSTSRFWRVFEVRRSFPTWTRWWPRSDETSSKPWSYSRSSRSSPRHC